MSTTGTPRGGLVFRPATLEDATFAADLDTALFPDEPVDPAWVRHWWQQGDPAWVRERFVIERAGRPVGFASRERPPWEKLPKRYDRLGADLLPDLRTSERLGQAHDFIEEHSRADGSQVFSTWAREDDGLRVEFLLRRGYREERRGKQWELDLVRHRERLTAMAEASRAKMRDQGIQILTLADDPDPEKYRKLWRMHEEATVDTPRTIPYVAEPFEIFIRWIENPGIREDRFWIAKVGEGCVGCSVLLYPHERGDVWTDWTGTARSVRGKGVARALKLETVLQAMALGVRRVRTGNDGANAPILHINATMGYEPISGWINFMKEA